MEKCTPPLVGGTAKSHDSGCGCVGGGQTLGTIMKSTTGHPLGYNYYISTTHKVHSTLPYHTPKDSSNKGTEL